MRHPKGVQGLFMEHNEKRRAEHGIAPTPDEWVDNQPERWRLICEVFAVNVNTLGGITGKTIDDIVKTANARGVRISRRTLFRVLPDLERFGVVRQERHTERRESGEIRRKPSTWSIGLRSSMPDHILPSLGSADFDAIDAAWLKANGFDVAINEMNTRFAEQSPDPPF